MNPARVLIVGLLVALPAFAQKAARPTAPPRIPAQFHGVWGDSPENCRLGGDQIVIRQHHIVGMGGESGWTLRRILKHNRKSFTGLYDYSGEGFEEADITIHLRRLPDGKMRFDDTLWMFCRRHF
ncbi:MAG: hypothetical protein WAV95_20300 [Azonexus sp.]